MSTVDITLLKQHVRADDFSDDDNYLEHLLTTAEISVIAATNRTKAECEAIAGGVFPPPLKHAILMLAAHWYNQREAVSGIQMAEVPYTLQSIIKPYRKLERKCKPEE